MLALVSLLQNPVCGTPRHRARILLGDIILPNIESTWVRTLASRLKAAGPWDLELLRMNWLLRIFKLFLRSMALSLRCFHRSKPPSHVAMRGYCSHYVFKALPPALCLWASVSSVLLCLAQLGHLLDIVASASRPPAWRTGPLQCPFSHVPSKICSSSHEPATENELLGLGWQRGVASRAVNDTAIAQLRRRGSNCEVARLRPVPPWRFPHPTNFAEPASFSGFTP